MLKQFTVIDEKVVLNKPTKSASGRYWYNLHLVLVGTERARLSKENDFATLDKALVATAKKHEYQLAARAWMPDHIHLSLRGNIDESPMDIALAFMNNTAYALGQVRIWQAGFYTGTFSEYDLRALRGRL